MLNNTQVVCTYQEDNDKCSHLSDPYTSLHSDKAATSNHLHSQNRFFLQHEETQTNKEALLMSQGRQSKIVLLISLPATVEIKELLNIIVYIQVESITTVQYNNFLNKLLVVFSSALVPRTDEKWVLFRAAVDYLRFRCFKIRSDDYTFSVCRLVCMHKRSDLNFAILWASVRHELI